VIAAPRIGHAERDGQTLEEGVILSEPGQVEQELVVTFGQVASDQIRDTTIAIGLVLVEDLELTVFGPPEQDNADSGSGLAGLDIENMG
jgi:hypothetical protein